MNRKEIIQITFQLVKYHVVTAKKYNWLSRWGKKYGTELHRNIAIRGFMSRIKSSINRFRLGLRPDPGWGSLRRSLRSHSRLGRDTPPHSPPPRRLRRLASQRFRRFDLGARA